MIENGLRLVELGRPGTDRSRGGSVEAGRGGAAGCHVDIPWSGRRRYRSLAADWALPGGDALLRTTYKIYDCNATIGFEQAILEDVDGFAADGGSGPATFARWGSPSSGFPSFDLNGSSLLATQKLGYASYGEIGRVRAGVFPEGYKSGAEEEDGVPLSLFDKEGRAVVLAPSQRFFDTVRRPAWEPTSRPEELFRDS